MCLAKGVKWRGAAWRLTVSLGQTVLGCSSAFNSSRGTRDAPLALVAFP